MKRNDKQVERLVRFAKLCADYATREDSTLTDREWNVFYSAMVEGMLLSDIAQDYGITQERTRQILEKAMLKIAKAAYLQKCKIKRIIAEL